MESSNAVDGMKITDNKTTSICEGCIFGKMCRRSFPCSSTDPDTLEVGQLIVSDVGGPMQEKSLSGCLYYLAIKDKASGLRKVYFLKHKSKVAGKFRIYVPSFQNETGKLIKAIRTDNGGEFKGQAWIWADELGIQRQYTISHTPQQNGASERDNRTIVEEHALLCTEGNIQSHLVYCFVSGLRPLITPSTHSIASSLEQDASRHSRNTMV